MKAVIFSEHGQADVLKYRTVKEPLVRAHEVLIDIKACSINHLDIWCRMGLPGIDIPLPHIPGSDIAGTVAKAGTAVKDFKKGDRVIAAPGMGCLRCRYCTGGWESLCPSYNILGFQIDGGYAQKIAVDARRILKISDTMTYEQWAAVPLVFLTAWHMLHTHGNVRSGDNVLVHAAGSGIGSAAIQIARLAGATVFTTVGSKAKEDQAAALGADHVINYNEADFSKYILDETRGAGCDIIFEHIGISVWEKSLKSLARGGRLITCGATAGGDVQINLRFLFMRQQKILGSYMGSREELLKVLNLIESGKLQPVIDSVYPLEDASSAHEHIAGRNHFGKVVLKCAP